MVSPQAVDADGANRSSPALSNAGYSRLPIEYEVCYAQRGEAIEMVTVTGFSLSAESVSCRSYSVDFHNHFT